MAKITLQGNPINTSGNLPQVGTSAPDFILVDSDLNNVSLETYKGYKKILNIVPSLDTPVCQKSTKEFKVTVSLLFNIFFISLSSSVNKYLRTERLYSCDLISSAETKIEFLSVFLFLYNLNKFSISLSGIRRVPLFASE